jgi:hypothetical protein
MGRNIMNRRNILNISTMMALGLALLPASAIAQQGTQRGGPKLSKDFYATPLIKLDAGRHPPGSFMLPSH